MRASVLTVANTVIARAELCPDLSQLREVWVEELSMDPPGTSTRHSRTSSIFASQVQRRNTARQSELHRKLDEVYRLNHRYESPWAMVLLRSKYGLDS